MKIDKLTEALEETATFVFMDSEGAFFDVVFQGQRPAATSAGSGIKEETAASEQEHRTDYLSEEQERQSERTGSHTSGEARRGVSSYDPRNVDWAIEADQIMVDIATS
eukprot:755065-Hanusia_phi.AAC.1